MIGRVGYEVLFKILKIMGRLGVILVLWVSVFLQVFLQPLWIVWIGFTAGFDMPHWAGVWIEAQGFLALLVAGFLTCILVRRKLYAIFAAICILWLVVSFLVWWIPSTEEELLGELYVSDSQIRAIYETLLIIATLVVWGILTHLLTKRRLHTDWAAIWTLWMSVYYLVVFLVWLFLVLFFRRHGYTYESAPYGFAPVPIVVDCWGILPGPTLTLVVAGILTYLITRRRGGSVGWTALFSAIVYLWILIAWFAGTVMVLFPDPLAECYDWPHRCNQPYRPVFLVGVVCFAFLVGITLTYVLVKRWSRGKVIRAAKLIAFTFTAVLGSVFLSIN